VRKVPNRRAADVHSHFAFFERLKLVDRARERVEKPEHKWNADALVRNKPKNELQY